MRQTALAIAWLLSAACSGAAPESGAEGTWVGTITTEDNLATVVNESGSLWGGDANLVEEASIGVAEGEDAYLLGLVRAVAASGERLYVLDASARIVRAYTRDGDYVGDVGGRGEGPGEYRQPMGLGVSADGRLFVHDPSNRRVSIYSSEGAFLDSHFLPHDSFTGMVVSPDGTTFGAVVVDPQERYDRLAKGMLAHGRDGPSGSPIIPPRYEIAIPHLADGRGIKVPHAPEYVWAMDRWTNMIAGAADTYSFEIVHPGGSRTLVRRTFEPVSISAEERDDLIAESTSFMRMRAGDSWTWDGPEVPWFKPAFVRFMPTQSGEIWVVRPGPSHKIERPDGSVRWRDTYTIDAFAQDGRFLGEVEMPPLSEAWIRYYATGEGGPFAFVDGDTVVLPTEDDEGTIMVRRYRLVLPGDAPDAR